MLDFHLIQYYCREKFYHTMRVVADSGLKNEPDNPAMKLQFCVALILEDQIGEAVRELEPLLLKQDVALAAMIATIHAQNLCEVPDGEAVITLENRLKSEKKKASETALYYAANSYLQICNFEKAQEYTDTIFRLNHNSSKGFLLKGWLELNVGKLTIAADCFKSVLSQDSLNFDAAMGEALSLTSDDAVAKLNQLIVKYPKLTPPLIEKMKLLQVDRDWEQAMDIANRILTVDSFCIPALQFKVVHDIRMRGDFDNLIQNSDELISFIKHQEPKNWIIGYEFGTLLARLYGHNGDVVHQSIKFIEEALILAPENTSVNMELAHQHYLLKNYQKAVEIYKKVARIDDSATGALIGLIKCRIIKGDFNEEIKQQIDFLTEVYDAGSNADLLLLQAANAENKMAEKMIIEAIELKLNGAENSRFGLKYLIELDAPFILEALRKFPTSVTCKPFKTEVLRKLTDVIPGLIDAWLMLADTYLEIDNRKDAEFILRHVLNNLDRAHSTANLMLTSILIQLEKFEEAESALDLCLSLNLNVRSKPLFHFLVGKIHKYKNNFQECIKSMQSSISCMTETEYLKPLDLASLYLDLSSSYQITRQAEAATDAIQKATHLLEGTSQEDRIIMARAELELWKNDWNKALVLLSSIIPDSPMYLVARTKMAAIYLKYSKDPLKYIECYKELAEENPTQENLIKLAEAYFSIRKITEAVEIYERAIKKKPSPKLSKKLAEMYCKCHQYSKALRCYREAGAEGAMDLAHLLFRLEQWESVERTLSHVPLQEKAVLLSKVKEKLGDVTTAINLLNEAYKKYSRSNDTLAAQLLCQMAEYEASNHDFDSATRHYNLALSHCKGNANEVAAIQISLSKLYLQVNDWTACQTICSSLLSRDPNNELALMMSADLSFRRCNFVAASDLLKKLLVRKPSYWLGLVRMVEVKRRMGMLRDVKPYLENAAAFNPNDLGLVYCTGLYHWFDNNIQEAVKLFNCVKYDPEWGQQALHNMVEIYLSGSEHHELAESLLQEIQPNSRDEETNRSLLVNFVLLASKDKQLIEKAMNDFTVLASRDILRVGASLGLATGYMLQKQPQRARNVLKIIAKTVWQFEEAEYLERCWLILADHYVQSGKHELAYELIKKILMYNAGCAKAHELLGIIAEKDQKYGDAASHYVKAWALSGQRDPVLGYRLGMFFLKSKRYADAISTCQAVLKNVPDSVKIKKDIYEKSLTLLRT